MSNKYCLTGIIILLFVFAFRLPASNYSPKDLEPNGYSVYNADSTAEQIFVSHCYNCHRDSAASMAPGTSILSTMTPRAILASLNHGKMRQQGANLSEQQRKDVAEWITKRKVKTTDFPREAYTDFALNDSMRAFDHSGWGNDKQGTGFRTRQQAGISAANVSSLKLKWAFAFPEAGIMRSKPALAGDWLIVGGQFGDVFALNKNNGKIGWHFVASAAIRGAIYVERETAYFADFSTNVYALDIKTGKMIWNNRAGFDAQSAVTGSVVVHNGKVYVPISSVEVSAAFNGEYRCCFSSGGVVALDAKTGKEIWKHRIVPRAKESGKTKNGKPFYGPSGAPVWCSPTVDEKRGLLYIGTGQNYSYPATSTSDAIQALDLKTGKVVWNFQATKGDAYNVACPFFNNCPDGKSPDVDFGMAPILVKRKDGKEVLVVGQKSGVVHALVPESGKMIWQTRIGKGGKLGGIHWGMATDQRYVYAANSDNVVAIDKTDSSIRPTPGIYALDVTSGKIIWKATPDCATGDCQLSNSAAPAVIPGVVFAGGLDGHIRAYSAETGKILWDYNTVRDYETTNGIKGRGGAIDGPAPVIADGMLFVNSGYGMFGQLAGNVLLAFQIDNH